MQVRFWGVRGSIAVSGERFADTGGNTTCVEVNYGGHRLVLDGGTGLRALGEYIGFRPITATLLFTHVHWDHIQGVPFFTPAFHPDSDLHLVGVRRDSGTLRDALARQMTPPGFPVGLSALVGARRFEDVEGRQPFDLGPFHVIPLEQDHPDGVVAYRIEAGDRALVFATDVEHRDGVDRRLVELSEGADLLVHDAQYTHQEYEGEGGPARVGWGHSTWRDAVDVARQGSVGQLALFHHDPTRHDLGISAIERAAQADFPGAFAAREGLAVAL